MVRDALAAYHEETGRYGLISSNYDTELFGHWWFEGVSWIKQVLLGLAQTPEVGMTTASEYLQQHPPQDAMVLPESSWGAGGSHWTWENPDTQWVWRAIHRSEHRMEQLVEAFPVADEATTLALDQAARELLLLQASDWPFLITTGQAGEYARQRVNTHLERFEALADILEQGPIDGDFDLVDQLYNLDSVFPTINYHWFSPRQGRAT